MQTVLEALFNIGMATIGLGIFVGWKVRHNLTHFDWGVLWRDNKNFWIWSIFMQTIIAVLLAISPESGKAIKTMIGLDVTSEPTAFVSLGWALALGANTAAKKKKI